MPLYDEQGITEIQALVLATLNRGANCKQLSGA
jgi:hypothetical protein